MSPPTAARTVDTFRIAVRPVPGELQVYAGASWARAPSDMIEDVIMRTLEDSGRIPGVARRGSGVAPDYRLLLDLRRFEADYAGAAIPSATNRCRGSRASRKSGTKATVPLPSTRCWERATSAPPLRLTIAPSNSTRSTRVP